MVFITVAFFVLALAGIPLVFALLLTTFATLWWYGLTHPVETILLTYIGGVEPFVLIAVPLFIVGGELISRGGVGKRIVAFAHTLFGFLPGGLGVVTVFACLLFGGVSGSAIAGSAAIGTVMIPAMVERGYSAAFAAALVAVAGTLAVIIPPSIPMLVFGFVSGASVRDLFLAGVVPGVLFGVGLMLVCVRYGIVTGCDRGGERASLREIRTAFVAAFPALLMPVIILGGIWFGVFTPTEAAAVAVVYGLVVSMFFYGDIGWRELPALVLRAFTTSAVVMVVIGATAALAWVITVEQVPLAITEWVRSVTDSKWMFLLLANFAMLLLGIFIEPLPALILSAPLFVPLAQAYGVDLVHLGLIMTCNLAIGLYTPPVGGTLFVAAKLAQTGIGKVSVALLPMLAVTVVVLFAVTYIEALPMGLVWLLR
ncbi:MAG: TRAP transporter large permease [Burkholderiales bacterium]|jgi:C4-dicarboxylate transporter DctM subunit|nr:TRAP transporter large permease [Burkholderiales bacterium]